MGPELRLPTEPAETDEEDLYTKRDLGKLFSLAAYDALGKKPYGDKKEFRFGDYAIYHRLDSIIGSVRKDLGGEWVRHNSRGRNRVLFYTPDQIRRVFEKIRSLKDSPSSAHANNMARITLEAVDRAEELLFGTPKEETMERYDGLVMEQRKERGLIDF